MLIIILVRGKVDHKDPQEHNLLYLEQDIGVIYGNGFGDPNGGELDAMEVFENNSNSNEIILGEQRLNGE